MNKPRVPNHGSRSEYTHHRCRCDACTKANNRYRVPLRPLTELDPLSLAFRFWARVDIGASDECWPWRGKPNRNGYATYRNHGAHRIAVFLTTGAMPTDFVCHHCDNPPCCNPSHLFVGTPLDNVRDMQAKGRSKVGVLQAMQTHCIHGHAFDEANTILTRAGHRSCRTCKNEWNRLYMRGYNARKRAEREAS